MIVYGLTFDISSYIGKPPPQVGKEGLKGVGALIIIYGKNFELRWNCRIPGYHDRVAGKSAIRGDGQ